MIDIYFNRIMYMKRTLHKVALLIVVGLTMSWGGYAQDKEWVRILTQDFGGNDVSDPVIAPATTLEADQVGDSLRYTASTMGNGVYCMVKQTENYANWHKGSDHTYPGDVTRGYYMRVNPKSIDKTVQSNVDQQIMFVQKLEGLCRGVTFKFTAYIANISVKNNETEPHLALGIYQERDVCEKSKALAYKDLVVPKALQQEVTATTLPWYEITLQFDLNTNNDYVYFIVAAEDPETSGFDFAIDDISIDVLHPVVTIKNDRDYEYHGPVNLIASFENNGFFPSMSNLVYRWYYSATGEEDDYAQIASGTYSQSSDFAYQIPNFDKDVNNGYYRVIIESAGAGYSKVCSLQGDFRINETKNKKHVHLCHNDVINEADGVVLDASSLQDGDVVSGTDMDYVISKTTPKSVLGEDKYICIGGTYEGVTYDTETSFPINDTIKSMIHTSCDSLYVLKTLFVTSPKEIPLEDKHICQGETYRSKTYNTPTTEVIRYSDDSGCMTYVQNVIVHESYSMNKTYTICAGSSLNNETFDIGGTFSRVYTYQSVYGCDSIENATIIVTDKVIADLEPVFICEGDSYVFDGHTYTAPGVYDLFSTSTSKVSGCDSITRLRLTINANYSNINNPIDTVICYGSPLFDKIYEEPTTSPILVRDPNTYKTVSGCDSIVYFNLTVLQIELRLKVRSNRNTICGGEQVEIDVANLRPADALLSWSHTFHGTERKALFTPTEDMTYVVLARNEKAGCEATDTVRIYVKDTPYLTIDSVDQRENIVQYHTDGGTAPYTMILDKKPLDQPETGELTNSFIGVHTLSVKDSTGCVSSQQFEIIPIPITPGEFLTPNNDGVNDVWTIENIELYAKARVRIFSRNGKLLKEFWGADDDAYWDGTYMGHLMPATDYWYEINLPEVDRQYLGHFTLIHEQ